MGYRVLRNILFEYRYFFTPLIWNDRDICNFMIIKYNHLSALKVESYSLFLLNVELKPPADFEEAIIGNFIFKSLQFYSLIRNYVDLL